METAEGSLSNSSTSTSLDTVLLEQANELKPIPSSRHTIAIQPHSKTHHKSFSPIPETEESKTLPSDIQSSLRIGSDHVKISKGSLKSSKVSFEQPADPESSDEDSFEEKREHFQQKKSKSADHKGILKVHMENYYHFQINIILMKIYHFTGLNSSYIV